MYHSAVFRADRSSRSPAWIFKSSKFQLPVRFVPNFARICQTVAYYIILLNINYCYLLLLFNLFCCNVARTYDVCY